MFLSVSCFWLRVHGLVESLGLMVEGGMDAKSIGVGCVAKGHKRPASGFGSVSTILNLDFSIFMGDIYTRFLAGDGAQKTGCTGLHLLARRCTGLHLVAH